MSNQMKEIPCPHCGQDLRLPEECNLETWNALKVVVEAARAYIDCPRIEPQRANARVALRKALDRPGVQALVNTP